MAKDHIPALLDICERYLDKKVPDIEFQIKFSAIVLDSDDASLMWMAHTMTRRCPSMEDNQRSMAEQASLLAQTRECC